MTEQEYLKIIKDSDLKREELFDEICEYRKKCGQKSLEILKNKEDAFMNYYGVIPGDKVHLVLKSKQEFDCYFSCFTKTADNFGTYIKHRLIFKEIKCNGEMSSRKIYYDEVRFEDIESINRI